MKNKYIFIFSFVLLSSTGFSQLGINLKYQKHDFAAWQEVLKEVDLKDYQIFDPGIALGLDYGFGLKHYRIDFYPEILFRYSWYNNEERVGLYTKANLIQYGFNLTMQVYALDLLSKQGMQCPSFNRGGDIFSKGWFISVQPGVLYSNKKLEFNADLGNPGNLDESKMIFGFGIGTGMDIGISESVSITPSIIYHFYLSEEWQGYSAMYGQDAFNDITPYSSLTAGIRLGFWF